VLRSGPYRLIFFSSDWSEPPHVHVFRDEAHAKFWLNPVRLEGSRRFKAAELLRIERLVGQNAEDLLRSWNEYFD
jgi:hypothetical protein